jgi:hypothetical protein
MKVFDYKCPKCGMVKENVMVTAEEEDMTFCGDCSAEDPENPVLMEKLIGGTVSFTKTIPTYPGSQRRKAGYQHKYVNGPATKTQVGVGGGITKGDD